MTTKQLFVCSRKEIYRQLSFTLKEFDKQIDVTYFQRTAELETALEQEEICCLLILDSLVEKQSMFDLAKKIKSEKPSINILMLVPSDTTKDELIEIISTKVVCGVLLIPFTSQQVETYVARLCDIVKEEPDNPLLMKKSQTIKKHIF
ncbi:MAG: hypothetical protein HQL06_16560 [Nitrospirae bacterium]|nr:hypothetical protein [Nitrospirota bacterium]